MVRVLGIATSGAFISVAVTEDHRLLAEVTVRSHMDTLRDLVPTVDRVLKTAGCTLPSIQLIAVTTGPGSWTSLRIVVGTAKTLAQATGIPLVGVVTFDALAANARFVSLPVWCAVDARQGKVVAARFDCSGASPQRIGSYCIMPVGELLECDGPQLYLGDIGEKLRSCAQWNPSKHLTGSSSWDLVNAWSVCEIALQRYLSVGPDDALALAPSYMVSATPEARWELEHGAPQETGKKVGER